MDKSQWKISDGFIAMLVIAFGIAFLAMQILPMLADTGKPHGNSRNLIFIHHQITMWKNQTTNASSFDFSTLSDDAKLTTIFSVRNLDGYFKTNFLWRDIKAKREIVIVSHNMFSNVHKPGFWNSFIPNPAHAVGYSDGTVGLISPIEFSNLNLSEFVSAANLATNFFEK